MEQSIDSRVAVFNGICLEGCGYTMGELGFYVDGDCIKWKQPN